MEKLIEEIYTFKGKVEDVENDHIINVQMKLREYEQAEENGLLLRLPCKTGDKIYVVNDIKNQVYPLIATNDLKFISGKIYVLCESFSYADYISFDDMGKTAFQTKEEAEQALEQLKAKEIEELELE